jgi:hypothetical protein
LRIGEIAEGGRADKTTHHADRKERREFLEIEGSLGQPLVEQVRDHLAHQAPAPIGLTRCECRREDAAQAVMLVTVYRQHVVGLKTPQAVPWAFITSSTPL